MSTTIGFLTESFSLVAADDRTTNCLTPGEWKDSQEKMFQTPWGFVAASGGISGVLMRFKEYLLTYKIKTRNDIWTLFCQASRECENYLLKTPGSWATKYICLSKFLYTFMDEGKLCLELVDFGYNTRRLKENNLVINSPKDTIRIKRLKAKYYEQAKHIQDMHEALYLVACVIDDMSKLTKLISNNVNCGIICKLSEDEAVFLQVWESAKTIKKLYKQKQDLSEIMMVCGTKEA